MGEGNGSESRMDRFERNLEGLLQQQATMWERLDRHEAFMVKVVSSIEQLSKTVDVLATRQAKLDDTMDALAKSHIDLVRAIEKLANRP